MVFAAYGVVALWNLAIAYVVMWLFSRKYVKCKFLYLLASIC